MSAIRNYPVICREKQIGLLQSVSLDDVQRNIGMLIVSCGISGKRIVFREDILALSGDFILVNRSQRYKRIYEKKPCLFVRDTAGLLVGRITDYAIDEKSLRVVAVCMTDQNTIFRRNKRIWTYEYACANADSLELTVPVCLGSELI